ncbi:MAG: hypothetical protein HUJ76_03450 [Parasporobacterium sp.]|nr:hypothetical protein [Parasporobacterium sp.]
MKRTSKFITFIIAAACVMAMLPVTAFAEGSYYVDTSYLVLNPGETGYITVYFDQAAGRVDWTGSGAVNAGGSEFLDNGSTTIAVTATTPGTGYVTFTPTDIGTYDGEALDYSYTVQVDVLGGEQEAELNQTADPVDNTPAEAQAEQAAAPQDEAPAEQAEAAAEDNIDAGVLTDGNNDFGNLSEEERLYTTVDGKELYIIRYPLFADENGGAVWNDEVRDLDRLEGFNLKTVNYKGMDVDAFSFNEGAILAFVLLDPETDQTGYYVLGDKGFEPLAYLTANGKQYIVIDFEDDYAVPAGYDVAELTMGTRKIRALCAADGARKLKGYEVVVSPGLESEDPTGDMYYIYCLVDGEKQLYCYDSKEGTLQRAAIMVYNEVPTEPETVVVYETVEAEQEVPEAVVDAAFLEGIGWSGMPEQMKYLLISLGVAIVLLIVLIITLIATGAKNRKIRKNLEKQIKAGKPYGNHPGRAPRDMSDRKSAPKGGRPDPKSKTSGMTSEEQKEEQSFFSYVKTEKDDEVDLNNLK